MCEGGNSDDEHEQSENEKTCGRRDCRNFGSLYVTSVVIICIIIRRDSVTVCFTKFGTYDMILWEN